MNFMVQTLGKVLQLVGISSPEDAAAKLKPKTADDPPSWRDALITKSKVEETEDKEG